MLDGERALDIYPGEKSPTFMRVLHSLSHRKTQNIIRAESQEIDRVEKATRPGQKGRFRRGRLAGWGGCPVERERRVKWFAPAAFGTSEFLPYFKFSKERREAERRRPVILALHRVVLSGLF